MNNFIVFFSFSLGLVCMLRTSFFLSGLVLPFPIIFCTVDVIVYVHVIDDITGWVYLDASPSPFSLIYFVGMRL